MKKSYLLLLVVLNLPFTVFSQINSTDELVKKYNNYFELERETLYTHLNKTRFVEGEEIWFKSYIYNDKYQIPYVSTTNIYVSIFNKSGKLLVTKLYFASDGFTSGNFLVDNKFTPGIYFVKTTTSWMKNFKEDLSHVQMIEIIGNDQEIVEKVPIENKYDFQLLPEGGHIIQNVSNTIGFKLINEQGNGVIIRRGTVFDENKNIVTTFKSNQFGLGRFSLNAKESTNYIVSVTLANDKIITKPIGLIEKKGISLKVEATNSSNVIIALETNQLTLPELIGKPYNLLIHRDGQIKEFKIDFVANQLKYLISVKKSELLPGINILTLINQNYQPIAERLVFNNLKTPIKSIEVAKIVSKGDSSIVTLKTNIKAEINPNFSVSLLPASTESYNQSTIITTFLLAPYIKGNIENSYYYFSDTDRRTLYNLDLLLLNQGWSKYSWDAIFKNPPKANYAFETGFQIKGSLNNYKPKDGDMIVFSSPENQIHEATVIEKGTFSFENLFIADSTSINFSLKNKNGKLKKPTVSVNISPKKSKDNLQNVNTYPKNKFYTQQTDEKINIINFNDDGITLLDTVVLKSTLKKKKPKNKPLVTVYGARYINLVESDFQNLPISSIIINYGFDVVTSIDNVKILSRRTGAEPSIYVDHQRLFNFKSLVNMRVSDVEDMYVSRTPQPGDSSGGTIKIFTRSGEGLETPSDKYQVNDNLFGFSMPKKYYTPNYRNTNSEEFLKLGAIHWIPNLTPNETGELIFKIPNYSSETINLYIEGMSYDGSLWSKRETINLAK